MKTVTVTLKLGTADEPQPLELKVKEPSKGDRDALAAHVLALGINGLGGRALAEASADAFALLRVDAEQLAGLTPVDRVFAGYRLAQWASETDSGN